MKKDLIGPVVSAVLSLAVMLFQYAVLKRLDTVCEDVKQIDRRLSRMEGRTGVQPGVAQ